MTYHGKMARLERLHTSLVYMCMSMQQVPSYQEVVGGSDDLEHEEEDGIMKMKRFQLLQQTGKGKEGGGEGRRVRRGFV